VCGSFNFHLGKGNAAGEPYIDNRVQ